MTEVAPGAALGAACALAFVGRTPGTKSDAAGNSPKIYDSAAMAAKVSAVPATVFVFADAIDGTLCVLGDAEIQCDNRRQPCPGKL